MAGLIGFLYSGYYTSLPGCSYRELGGEEVFKEGEDVKNICRSVKNLDLGALNCVSPE